MSKKSDLTLQGDLPIEIIKESDGYSAFCSTLNLVSQGKTVEEAIKMFGECFSVFVADLIQSGNLEKVFLEAGWRLEIQDKNSPVKIIIPPQILHTSIPLKTLMDA